MKHMLTIVLLAAFLISPAPALAVDCTKAYELLMGYRNNEEKLLDLLGQYPECGKIVVALGNYYSKKEMWGSAYERYQEALVRFFPNSSDIRTQVEKTKAKLPLKVENREDIKIVKRNLELDLGDSESEQPRDMDVRVLFDTGQAIIKPEYRPLLDEFAVEIDNARPDYSFAVKGHTDNVGGREYNQELSERRARAVRDYLVEQGVDPDRLEVEAYGEDDPLYSNRTPEGRQKNRRVLFEVHSNRF